MAWLCGTGTRSPLTLLLHLMGSTISARLCISLVLMGLVCCRTGGLGAQMGRPECRLDLISPGPACRPDVTSTARDDCVDPHLVLSISVSRRVRLSVYRYDATGHGKGGVSQRRLELCRARAPTAPRIVNHMMRSDLAACQRAQS